MIVQLSDISNICDNSKELYLSKVFINYNVNYNDFILIMKLFLISLFRFYPVIAVTTNTLIKTQCTYASSWIYSFECMARLHIKYLKYHYITHDKINHI